MIQIAIDGPSGSGKSSIAKNVAKKIGLTYLDTGAMYRAVTLYMLAHVDDLHDAALVASHLDSVKIQMAHNTTYLNGENVSEAIRQPIIDQNVSLISSYKDVRQRMVALQQKIAKEASVILDGRDIGTVVLPEANIKFFLTASPEIRAKRRIKDYERKGLDVTVEDVLQDILRRDYLDSTREESPLIIPDGAIILDTSDMTFNEVIDSLIQTIREYNHGTCVY